jgi:anaerobic selenocysteine-containing dehydrogenase
VADLILKGNPYPIEVAIGYNSNFNMSAPGSGRWDEAMAKIPFYVHVGPAITEMATFADIVLPACTFLEEWGYDHCPPGSGFAEMKLKQPAVERLYDSRQIADIVFGLAQGIGGTVAQSFNGIGDGAEGFTRYRTSTVMPWDEFRAQGVWVGPQYKFNKYDSIFKTPSKKFEFYSGNMEAVIKGKDKLAYLPHYKEAKFLGDEKMYPLVLATYFPLLDIDNGNQNYPWVQEIYMVLHGQGWSNFIEMNTELAHALDIEDGDMVWVESPFGKLQGKARVFQGIHPEVIAIANGQGHWACGRWARGMGVNPNSILGVDYDQLSGQSAFFNTRVKVYKARGNK